MIDEITVLLADDHALVRRGFRKILEDDEFIRVVGEASNGVEAIQKAQDLKPKVVVMDLSMPELDGVQATKEILKHVPGPPCWFSACMPTTTTSAMRSTPAPAVTF